MEEAPDGKSSNSDSKSSSMRAIIMKGLEYARNVKVVVAIFVVLVSCCLLLYYSSNNNNNYNFGQLLSFSSPFHSLNATPADPPDPNEPVHDEFYELRKALKAAATEDKTVILTTLNDAWAEPNNIFDIFLESFRIGNNTARLLNHLLVIAVDDKAYLRCQALVRHCYFFKSNHSKELAHEARFMTPIYLEMMWERLDFLRIILTLGYNFVFTALRDKKMPTAAELFEEMHTKKEGTEKVFCDKRAKSVWDEYQRLKLNASQTGEQVNDDELFLQAAGGVNKKGMVYGLGNHTQAFYERVKPFTQSSPSTSIAYTPSMYAQLVSRLQASEEQLNATRAELTLTKEEVKQAIDAIARIESRFGSSSS